MMVGGTGSAHPLAYEYSLQNEKTTGEPNRGKDETAAQTKPNTPQTGVKTTEELPEEDQQKVDEMDRREEEVRAHENAHKAAAGSYARGAPRYEYTTGPDGKRYITGGEISLDLSKESTPEKTIAKANTIRQAALAPASPSSADRSIAAQAEAMATQARAELAKEAADKREEAKAKLDKAETDAEDPKDPSPRESAEMSLRQSDSFESILSTSKVAAAKRAYNQEVQEERTSLARVA